MARGAAPGHRAAPAPCPSQLPNGLAPVCLLTLNLLHMQKREKKPGQIWLFGKSNSCNVWAEVLQWNSSGMIYLCRVGNRLAFNTAYQLYSEYPFRKHIYQGQTIPRACELLISQLTRRVRLKAQERGKKWLIFELKKQEIQAQLLSRPHKACRKLSPHSHPPLLIAQLQPLHLFIPAFNFSRPLQGEMGISSRIEAV